MFKKIRERRFNKRVQQHRQDKKAACARGEHVPVRMYHKRDEFTDQDEYCCQNCVKTMTRQEWEDYFSTPKMQEWRRGFDAFFGENWNE